MTCIGHRFVDRSGRSPLTAKTHTWSLEPGASPASIQAKTGNFLPRAASGISTAKVTQKVGGLGGLRTPDRTAAWSARVLAIALAAAVARVPALDRPGPADPRPTLRPAELVR